MADPDQAVEVKEECGLPQRYYQRKARSKKEATA
jgi:hypothetical protein